MIMIENASLLVYLWSVYEKIEELIDGILIGSGVCVVFLFVFRAVNISFDDEEMNDGLKKAPSKTLITVSAVALILKIAMPSKEYLPYIISASPIAKTIMDSYKDGKIHKVDKIIDKSLDKALEELQGNK